MVKKLMAIFGAAAVMSAASAKEINNFFDGDFPRLIPSVQKLERTGKDFRLPPDLAIAAPESAAREAKLAGDAISGRFGICKYHLVPEGEKAGMRLVLTEDGVPESPEGYTLSISPAGIEIKARDVRGLFYGVQTFGNIVRNNVVTTLPGCEIADWPDLGIRGVFLNLRFLKNQDVDGFCNVIRAYAALKYNTLVLEFAENLPMKDNPFTKRKEFLSEESLQKIVDTAKECHCEIIPHLQVLSHDTWMRMHPDYKEKITARVSDTTAGDWASSACPEKPLTRELTVYTIEETIRLLKPRRFHLAMDELMHCEWNKCNMCPNGHTVEQLVRETSFYTKLVADKGIEPWVYHDTFCDKDRSGGEAALPHLPKNTVINMWSYRADPTVQYFDFFQDKGFKTTGVSYVATLENLRSIPLACKKYRNLGAIMTYWGYLRDSFLRDNGVDALAAAGTVLAAEYQWKCSERSVHQWSYDPAWEIRRRLGKAPLRRRGSTYADIPVAGVCNAKLGADGRFPKLSADEVSKIAKELAGTPEGFKLNVTDDGRIAAAVLSDGADEYPENKITIPVDGFFKGLTLLMTASRPEAPQRLLDQHSRQRIRFFPKVAEMKVLYADGKTSKATIRYSMEINDWNASAGGCCCRMVVRGNASDGANYAIYAFDWNNPRPNAKVTAVELSTEKIPANEKIGVAPALLAVSANIPRGIKGGDTALGELREYNLDTEKKSIRKYTAVDFTNGRGKVRFSTEGDFVRPVTTEVVDDPGSPSGKALKVVMPPAKAGSRVPRAIVDVPVPKLEKLGSVIFSVRTDSPSYVRRSAAYFMDRKIERYNVIYNFMRKNTSDWQSFAIPFAMMTPPAPGAFVTLDNASTIRVSAWLENCDRDITLWFGPVAASPDEAKYVAPANSYKVGE